MAAAKLDKIDAKIMQILSQDGRISWRDLAERIGLSLTPTLRRIRRLESEGYITGYSAQFDEQNWASESPCTCGCLSNARSKKR
jgi:Lrp/AsnC family leucine-responsive transcriptional regulator